MTLVASFHDEPLPQVGAAVPQHCQARTSFPKGWSEPTEPSKCVCAWFFSNIACTKPARFFPLILTIFVTADYLYTRPTDFLSSILSSAVANVALLPLALLGTN